MPESADPVEAAATDVPRAGRFVAAYGDRVRHAADWGCWVVSDGRRRGRDGQGLRVERLAFGLGERPAGPLTPGSLTDAVPRSSGQGRVWLTVRSVRQLLAAARSHPAVMTGRGDDAFDRRPDLLTVANGTVDLRTGRLRPHDPADRLTTLCPHAYDPAAGCPRYDGLLAEMFAGDAATVQYVRDLAGYCLTGETTDQSFTLLVGEGANGKTVLPEAWAQILGHELTYHTPPELLMNGRADRHPPEKASLHGKRLVICSETEEDGSLNERRIKTPDRGDTITARFCFGDFFPFRPTHKLLLATNHRSRGRGTDDGIGRRVRLLEFRRQFWTAADVLAKPGKIFRPEDEADGTLLASLRGERPASWPAWSGPRCGTTRREGGGSRCRHPSWPRWPSTARTRTSSPSSSESRSGRPPARCCRRRRSTGSSASGTATRGTPTRSSSA